MQEVLEMALKNNVNVLNTTERIHLKKVRIGIFMLGGFQPNFTCNVGDAVQSLGREDTPEKEMTTHSSILACKIPGTEEPGRLESMGLQRVGHN